MPLVVLLDPTAVHVTLTVKGLGQLVTGDPLQGKVVSVTVVFRVAEVKLLLNEKSEAPSGMKQPAPHMPLTKSHA